MTCPHRTPSASTSSPSSTATCPTTTTTHPCSLPTMATTLARLQRAHAWAHLPGPSSSRALVYLPSHRHAFMSALSRDQPFPPPSDTSASTSTTTLHEEPRTTAVPSSKPPTAKNLSPNAASPQVAARPPPAPKAERARPAIRATKAAITLVRLRFDWPVFLKAYTDTFASISLDQTPKAVERLRNLLKSPTPQLIRIGVRNKGCAGLSYHLEYVEKPAKFDEVVEQDGVKVVIDSKALFSIIGSEMDWKEDGLRCVSVCSLGHRVANASMPSVTVRSLISRIRTSRTRAGAGTPSASDPNRYPCSRLYRTCTILSTPPSFCVRSPHTANIHRTLAFVSIVHSIDAPHAVICVARSEPRKVAHEILLRH